MTTIVNKVLAPVRHSKSREATALLKKEKTNFLKFTCTYVNDSNMIFSELKKKLETRSKYTSILTQFNTNCHLFNYTTSKCKTYN